MPAGPPDGNEPRKAYVHELRTSPGGSGSGDTFPASIRTGPAPTARSLLRRPTVAVSIVALIVGQFVMTLIINAIAIRLVRKYRQVYE